MAAAALVIGANLPDVDAILYFVDPDRALAFRRGWTHGVPALVVWPLVLWALLLAWSRLTGRSGPKPAGLGLLGLCCVGVWSHPSLDWLNTYGMRWWMPFDGTWFYGDSVFIVDPWLWLVLGLGVLLPRRPRAISLVVAILAAAAVTYWVGGRAPQFLPLVLLVCGLGLIAWLTPIPVAARHRAAAAALVLAVVYILGRIALHTATESRVSAELERRSIAPVERLLVGPLPGRLWSWDVLAATSTEYRTGRFDWRSGELVLEPDAIPAPPAARSSDSLGDAAAARAWEVALRDPSVSGFAGWVRFPWFEVEASGKGARVYLFDARYQRRRSPGFGGAMVEVSEAQLAGGRDR